MAKRALDLLVGTVLALAVTPIVLLLALAIAIQFRTSPFFVQWRVGRGGRPFRIVKLRTLPPETPAYADKYEVAGMRATGLPHLLRQLHLDELPQLWLVPFGRMSLVGPRPEMAFLHERMPHALASSRLQVRPGCTGLWQVSAHADALILEHPEYDLAYVTTGTLRLDAWIVWHTLRVLCGAPRHITVADLPAWAGATTPVPVPVPAHARVATTSRAEVLAS